MKTWDEKLVYIQHSYNIALHYSTNKSPFKNIFCLFTSFTIRYVVWTKEGSMTSRRTEGKQIYGQDPEDTSKGSGTAREEPIVVQI
jgi:hypothetical protein